MFARLYKNTKHGQILVLMDANEQEEPVIKLYCQPRGYETGICSSESPPYENTEEGWAMAEDFIKNMDKESAIEAVEMTILDQLRVTEVVEIENNQPSPTYH